MKLKHADMKNLHLVYQCYTWFIDRYLVKHLISIVLKAATSIFIQILQRDKSLIDFHQRNDWSIDSSQEYLVDVWNFRIWYCVYKFVLQILWCGPFRCNGMYRLEMICSIIFVFTVHCAHILWIRFLVTIPYFNSEQKLTDKVKFQS
jgi:hypothetical protein